MLDRTFAALADPTRRAIVDRLSEVDGLRVGVLARPFPMTLPAIIKHLDVLSDAGLVVRTRTGRTVTCRLAPAPMGEAIGWLERRARFWTRRLDNLAAVAEAADPPATGDCG